MSIERSEMNLPSKLETFIELAKEDSEEGWVTIDEELPEHRNDPELLAWARANTADEESGLRDLAATILESTDEPLTEEDIANLLALMREENPGSPYPSFRAACALAKRPNNEKIKGSLEEVRAKLQAFVDDEDVSDVAKQYLGDLGVK